MPRPQAVVLVSGGMDSCVTAAIAHLECKIAFLHLNYGQKTEKRELRAFNAIADYYQVDKRLVVEAEYFREIGGSSLTDDSIEVSRANLDSKEIPTSYVPFRNGNILSIGTSYAERIGAEKIYIGAMEEDSSGYPDCREDFFEAYQKAIHLGTRPGTRIEIITPVIHFSKMDIITRGIELNAPIDRTWSCYKDEELACGECDSCALRLRAFKALGLKDPIEYRG